MLKYIVSLGALTVLTACAATSETQTLAAAEAAPSQVEASEAQVEASETASAEPESHLDPDKMICKRQQITGSRLAGRKICKTRREWDQARAEARRGADGFINRAGGIKTDKAQ